MKVYVCEVFDGRQMDAIVVGVFSTALKAQEAGMVYLAENANGAKVIDWIRDGNDSTDWYTDNDNYNYSRHITEVELDEALA